MLREEVGRVPWEKIVELLAVNRLIAPRSDLSIHEKWFPQTAMAGLLDSDERVAEKDRLCRALDLMVEQMVRFYSLRRRKDEKIFLKLWG